MLKEVFYLSFLVAGLCWFILAVYKKTGLQEFAIINSFNKYYEKLFSCDFCISIRLSIIILLIYGCCDEFKTYYFLVPLIVSGITNKI